MSEDSSLSSDGDDSFFDYTYDDDDHNTRGQSLTDNNSLRNDINNRGNNNVYNTGNFKDNSDFDQSQDSFFNIPNQRNDNNRQFRQASRYQRRTNKPFIRKTFVQPYTPSNSEGTPSDDDDDHDDDEKAEVINTNDNNDSSDSDDGWGSLKKGKNKNKDKKISKSIGESNAVHHMNDDDLYESMDYDGNYVKNSQNYKYSNNDMDRYSHASRNETHNADLYSNAINGNSSEYWGNNNRSMPFRIKNNHNNGYNNNNNYHRNMNGKIYERKKVNNSFNEIKSNFANKIPYNNDDSNSNYNRHQMDSKQESGSNLNNNSDNIHVKRNNDDLKKVIHDRDLAYQYLLEINNEFKLKKNEFQRNKNILKIVEKALHHLKINQ